MGTCHESGSEVLTPSSPTRQVKLSAINFESSHYLL